MDPFFLAILAAIGNGMLSAVGAGIVTQQLADLGAAPHPMDKEGFQNWLLTDFVAAFEQMFHNVLQEEDLRRLNGRMKGIQDNMQEFVVAPEHRLDSLNTLDFELDTLLGELESLGLRAIPAYSVACVDQIAVLQERYRWFKDDNEKTNIGTAIDRHSKVLSNGISEWLDTVKKSFRIVEESHEPTGQKPNTLGHPPLIPRFGVSFWVYFCSTMKAGPFKAWDETSFDQVAVERNRAQQNLIRASNQTVEDTEKGCTNPIKDLIDKMNALKAKLPSLRPEDVGHT
ncbi:MAG: hypothetical protein ACLQU5_22505 [Isosphaeraceae bacterium]